MIGTYFSNNKEYAVRRVASYDPATKTITFDKPISKFDFVYDDLQVLVGMEVRVRSLSVYETDLRAFITNVRNAHPAAEIAAICNPLPSIQAREIWGYREVIGKVADEMRFKNLPIMPFSKYQFSQKKDSSVVSVDASTLVLNPLTGFKEVELSTLTGGLNYLNWEVVVNGVNVYGSDAVVHNGLSLGVVTTLTGAQLNMDSTVNGVATSANQTANKKPRLAFLKNAPSSGIISLKWSTSRWSGDSCHVYNGDDGSKLFGEVFYDFIDN